MAQSSSYSGRSQEDGRETPVLFRFHRHPGNAAAASDGAAQPNTRSMRNDRKTAELIIGNIDDNGFLQTTPEEMALNTGIAQDDFEHMLTLIQSFYPPGVGARDLRECLLIQLKRDGKQKQPRIQDHLRAHAGSWASGAFPKSRAAWASASSRCRNAPTTSRSSIRGPARFSPRRRKIMSCPT